MRAIDSKTVQHEARMERKLEKHQNNGPHLPFHGQSRPLVYRHASKVARHFLLPLLQGLDN